MLTELGGKAGCLCQPAKEGKLRCPLIVRPTSEDAITGNIFGTLKAINTRWWLPQLLNHALGTERFRQQVYRRLRIELWKKQPTFPRHLIPWDEGQTEVDVEISWENPATTVFIEMKYAAQLSGSTVHNNGQDGHASDQLARNARVGLFKCGWYSERKLFDIPPRDFVLLLISPSGGNSLVKKYRDPDQLTSSIPNSEKLNRLPRTPFIGELGFRDLTHVLNSTKRMMTKPEQTLVAQLGDYVEFKLSTLNRNRRRKDQ